MVFLLCSSLLDHCSIFASLTYLRVYAVSCFALSRDPCLVLRYIGLEMLTTLQCRRPIEIKNYNNKKNTEASND